jgi:dUTP pyrophosphatase
MSLTSRISYICEYTLEKRNEDAGFDVRSTITTVIPPHSRMLIPIGLRLSMTPDMYCQIHPRSGLATRGIDIGAGVIDSGYRNEIKVVLINNSNEDFTVGTRDRIAQIIFHPLITDIPMRVSQLDETDRGIKGFGSSGTS